MRFVSRRRCCSRGRYQLTLRMAQNMKSDTPTDFEPIAEYNELRDNVIGSWGFLADNEFAMRLAGVFVPLFLLALVITSGVYPPVDEEDGELLVRNIFASGLFASVVGLIVVFVVLLAIALQWDRVNKVLLQRSFTVEGRSMDQSSGDGGYYGYDQVKTDKDARRDKLLSNYETEPALRRVRFYLLGTAVATAAAWVGGSAVCGEMRMAPPIEEGEEKEQQEDWRTYTSGGANWSYAVQQKRRGFIPDPY